MLIVFEGIDGSGKTTLSHDLAEHLRARGRTVVETREPWTSPSGHKLRKILGQSRRTSTAEEEFELFHSDRKEHVQQVVRPALQRGDWVVQDRTFYSTAAYQGARGMDMSYILRLSREVAPEPNITYLLLVDPELCLRRIASDRPRVTSFERLESLQEVDRAYRRLASQQPSFCVIDAARPLVEVRGEVLQYCCP